MMLSSRMTWTFHLTSVFWSDVVVLPRSPCQRKVYTSALGRSHTEGSMEWHGRRRLEQAYKIYASLDIAISNSILAYKCISGKGRDILNSLPSISSTSHTQITSCTCCVMPVCRSFQHPVSKWLEGSSDIWIRHRLMVPVTLLPTCLKLLSKATSRTVTPESYWLIGSAYQLPLHLPWAVLCHLIDCRRTGAGVVASTDQQSRSSWDSRLIMEAFEEIFFFPSHNATLLM